MQRTRAGRGTTLFTAVKHCLLSLTRSSAVEKLVYVDKIVEVPIEKIKEVQVVKHVEVPGTFCELERPILKFHRGEGERG